MESCTSFTTGHPRGTALILVMIVAALLCAVSLLFIERARTEDRGTDVLRYAQTYDSMAEAGTEYGIREIANKIAQGRPVPTGVQTVAICGVTVSWSCTYVGTSFPDRTEMRDPVTDGWVVPNPNASGYVRYVYPYQVTASVNFDEKIGGPTGIVDPNMRASLVNKIVDFKAEPLFQFLAFYGGSADLEILNGPSASFSGRIHSNKSIYLGNNTYNSPNVHTLFNTNYLRCAGKMIHSRYNTADDHAGSTGGTVWIKQYGTSGATTGTNFWRTDPNATTHAYKQMESRWEWDNYGPTELRNSETLNRTGFDSNFQGLDLNADGQFSGANEVADFTQRSDMLWDGTVKTGAHGTKPLSVPKLGSTRSFDVPQGQGYQVDPATKQLKKGGTVVTDQASLKGQYRATAEGEGVVICSTGTADNTTLAFKGGTYSNTTHPGLFTDATMNDVREGKNVNLVEVNMKTINQILEVNNHNVTGTSSPDKTLIYMYRTDTLNNYLSKSPNSDGSPKAPDTPNGFRIANAELFRGPTSIVCEEPVYVRGDVNTGQDRPLNPSWDGTKWVDAEVPSLQILNETSPYTNEWTGGSKTVESTKVANANKYTKIADGTPLHDAWIDVFDAVFHDNGAGVNDKSLPAGHPFLNATKDNVIAALNARERKQGVSVMADAVNLLSNNWNPTLHDTLKTALSSNSSSTDILNMGTRNDYRTALPTIYNFAMLTGVVPTIPPGQTGNRYSGGLENYGRLHENWNSGGGSGRTSDFCFRGSFVNIFNSAMAQQPWGKGGVYGTPFRRWMFDPNFEIYNKLPPYPPLAVGAARVVWWK